MSKPLFFRGKKMLTLKRQISKTQIMIKNNKILFIVAIVLTIGLSGRLLNTQPVFYAYASVNNVNVSRTLQSPLFEKSSILADNSEKEALLENETLGDTIGLVSESENILRDKLYDIVGDSPIREMVPFISKREEKVAAFLVGIAKKESSFGSRSPLKDGETCYNYWGYKSSGERGKAMGYACFASAEEAVKVVGDRIEVLVNKKRDTPARMVDTWKCGTSCAGDPGAPSWVSTVALYFKKIVG